MPSDQKKKTHFKKVNLKKTNSELSNKVSTGNQERLYKWVSLPVKRADRTSPAGEFHCQPPTHCMLWLGLKDLFSNSNVFLIKNWLLKCNASRQARRYFTVKRKNEVLCHWHNRFWLICKHYCQHYCQSISEDSSSLQCHMSKVNLKVDFKLAMKYETSFQVLNQLLLLYFEAPISPHQLDSRCNVCRWDKWTRSNVKLLVLHPTCKQHASFKSQTG